MTNQLGGKVRHAGFAVYLRTGRYVAAHPGAAVETKFNPWHDPDDGKFTFSGGGRYFGTGAAGATPAGFARRPTQADGNRLASTGATADETITDAQRAQKEWRRKLSDPKNFTTYIVRPGDSLSKIAKVRRGLHVSDLAWLNGISEKNVLKPGQALRVPTQIFLEYNREIHRRDIELMFYIANHGGNLPPNLKKIPSIQEQIDSDWKTIVLNGNHYKVDFLGRARDIRAVILPSPKEKRSRSAQRNAGVPDRVPTDDGGHYVAPRFGGSPHPINHLAQNSSINRGVYRAIEDGWDKVRKAGHRVDVHIVPHLHGASRRPYELWVEWSIDGERHFRLIPNEKGKQKK